MTVITLLRSICVDLELTYPLFIYFFVTYTYIWFARYNLYWLYTIHWCNNTGCNNLWYLRMVFQYFLFDKLSNHILFWCVANVLVVGSYKVGVCRVWGYGGILWWLILHYGLVGINILEIRRSSLLISSLYTKEFHNDKWHWCLCRQDLPCEIETGW